MPCKIQIKENITRNIEERTNDAFNKRLDVAQSIARSVNADYGTTVVKFVQKDVDFIDREIIVPQELVDRYYNHELALEEDEARGIQQEDAERAGEQISDEYMFQKEEEAIPTSASPQTLSLIKDFLKNIGVDVKSMDNIVVNGIKQDANAVALLAQKLIQVIDGKEATALPEEAMHFAVAIIKQTNPALYKKLMGEINSYAIMNEVFTSYGNDPAYQIDGKPNVIKLKEEAIAKVLVETIINNNENNTEKPERIAKAEGWWDQIVNYLKNLFTKSGFDMAAMKIIRGEAIGTVEDIRENAGEMFFQLSKQQQVVNSIRDVANRIEKKAVKNELGGEEEKYFIDGKQIKNRVSNIIKTWYDDIRAQDALTDSEYKKAINTLKADKGTAGHKDFEYAFSLFVDENGKLRDKDAIDRAILSDNHISFIDPNNNTIYELLRDNLRARLESFPKDTVFMSEVTIFDPKRDVAGTVDFLAITPEGKVNILDWKFIGLDTLRYQDVPWYNVASWDRQMKQYKTIIKDNYGVDNKDFEQTRMIPIRAVYSEANPQTKVLPKLLQIEIGDVNIKNIKQDYLVPVGVAGERVIIENDKEATKKINSLLDKLNDVYTKLAEQKVLQSERLNKNEQLNALYSAIRQLQMKQDVGPLIYQSKILNVQIQSIINNYNEKYKGKTDLNEKEIEEFTKTLRLAEDALQHYLTLDLDLDFLFEGKLSDEDKELQDEIRETAYQSRKINSNLSDIFTEFTVEQIGGTENGEKVVKGLFSRQLGTTSTIQLKGMAALYKKANAAFGRAGMDTQTEVARLTKLRSAYQAWASAKGLGAKDMFNIIKKKGSNELIDEFRPEFYNELKRATDKNVKDIKWIKDNIDVEAYRQYLDEKRQEEYKRIDNLPRLGTQEQNENDIAAEKAKAAALYNIVDDKSLGWLLYKEAKQFPKADWQSEQWKELHKKGNEPALDFYNYIIERNKVYADTGYIPNGAVRTFLPWVRKGLAEKLVFGGKITIGEQFLKNISVDEEEVGLGRFDPITGKTINKIPKYLTREFEGDASEDLFKTMSMYNEFAIKFQYLSDMENQALALLRLEKNKKAIATSMFGKTQKDANGDLVYINDNTENSKLIEDMIKAIVYQQKYIESEAFDQLLGKFGNFGTTINNKLGFKLLPESLDGRQLSINKVITQMNNTFQVTALGLNVLSSTSNYFGGTAQGFINAGKYFTKREYMSTEAWLLSNKMGGDIDKKTALAALEYFVPFTENYNKHAATKLSINKLDDQAIQDWLMILMRKGDEAVQTVNFFSFLKNAIVVDGQVLNAREYLKTTDEFRNFYQGTQAERDARAAKFEKAVTDIVKEKGVLNISKVVDGELVIPGVERKSDSVIEFRRKVQSFTADALGSMTEENKRLLNLNVYGNSFMVFKNWIPRLVDVRMGNVKYNAASDAYEWGRTRMIARIISDDLRGSLGNLKNSLMGNDKGIEYIRELYEKKRSDYKADTNKELEMTEDEFIDLVRQNIKNQLIDVLFYAALWAIFLGLKAMAPDDDEDPIVKNQWKFMLKATDKFKDEIGYFYNPTSLTNLVSQGAFPAIGLITNYEKGVVNFIKESYGLATGDEDLVKKTNVIKYWMKTNPITNQAAGMLPMFYPDLAKDLGIKMQAQSGIR